MSAVPPRDDVTPGAGNDPERLATDIVVDDLEADNEAAVAGPIEPTSFEGRTPWQLAKARLYRDKITMFILGVVALAVLAAILAPILTALGVLTPNEFHQNLTNTKLGGYPLGKWGGISWSHPLGVEPQTGRDVLSRLMLGISFSLLVAIFATLVAAVIGTVLGLIAGYAGGRTDRWVSRIVDMTLSFPQTLMLLALSAQAMILITKAGVPEGNPTRALYIILVLGLFAWPYFARIIRGQVLSLREREFVEAARSLGANRRRIYFRELLPNLWAPILVYSTMMMPSNISAEAALSYLGVGINPPTPTLGNILTNSVNFAPTVPTYFIVPGLAIATLVLSFNLLGDGLRDALDPKADR